MYYVYRRSNSRLVLKTADIWLLKEFSPERYEVVIR